MRKTTFSLLLCLAMLAVGAGGGADAEDGQSRPADPVVGVKLPRLMGDEEAVVKALVEAKVNTVFAGQRARESEAFRRLCRENGIALYAIFGVFIDAAAIQEDPSLSQINSLGKPMTARRRSYRLVCPNREDYRGQKIEVIASWLKENPVDGLSLDFIRYGVEWEMVKPDEMPGPDQEYCFCPVCLAKFGEVCDLPDTDSVPELAAFILEHCREEWATFKSAAVTRMVEEIRRAAREAQPDIQIAIHALPWTDEDYDDGPRRLGGQDFAALADSVDMFSPMSYHYMLHREPEFVHRQAKHMKELGCRVVPCIQAGLIFRRDEGFTAEEFDKAVAAALQLPSDGINLYIWSLLDGDAELMAIWLRHIEGVSADNAED